MKIAIIVSTFPPYQGGMGNMARSYAEGLSLRGHSVEVFCPAYTPVADEPDAPYIVRRLRTRLKFHNSAFVPRLFRLLSGFDLINLHYPFYGGAEAVLIHKKTRGRKIPLIVNYQMDSFGRGPAGVVMSVYQHAILPPLLRRANKVIATSLDYAAHAATAGAFRRRPEKFVAIPPGVNAERFAPRPKSRERLDRMRIGPEERTVLFVGGLDRAHSFKGVSFLLKTWADFKPRKAKLLIVGRGDLRDRYRRTAENLGIGPNVVFDDSAGEGDLPAVYNLADLFVLPSLDRSEAFGIVLIEAMASGVPVLASALPGVRSVVENGRNGFTFGVGNREELKARLALCLNDDSRRLRMASTARNLALIKYEQTLIWGKIDKIFREVFVERRPDGEGNEA